jgi:methanogenic corrinoid protein MtbC1
MGVDGATFDAYWAAVALGEASAATRLAIEQYDAGVTMPVLLDELVCVAQAEVGRLWAANEWNIAQEHRATSVSEDVVAALAARIETPATGRSVVISCAEGEWHALPSRVLSTALRAEGWRVTFLGASVPARQLAPMLQELGPDVTAISCALPARLFDAREMIEVSRSAGVPVLIGGRGFGPQGR